MYIHTHGSVANSVELVILIYDYMGKSIGCYVPHHRLIPVCDDLGMRLAPCWWSIRLHCTTKSRSATITAAVGWTGFVSRERWLMYASPPSDQDGQEEEEDVTFIGQRSGRVMRPLGSGKQLLSHLFKLQLSSHPAVFQAESVFSSFSSFTPRSPVGCS